MLVSLDIPPSTGLGSHGFDSHHQDQFNTPCRLLGNGHHPFKVTSLRLGFESPMVCQNTALAQSGERYPVTVEATGSKPVRSAKHAPVAQLVEHMIEDHGRVGSTPTGCTKYASVAEMD